MIAGYFDMSGKTALITGASGTLGIEHSIALLECGASIVITDVDTVKLRQIHEELQSEFPSNLVTMADMDVTSHASIFSVYQRLSDQNIYIDVLINNAAIDAKVKKKEGLDFIERFENFSRERWDMEIAVGLTGSMLCSQVFGQNMAVSGKGGVILNIASDLSVVAPNQKLYRKDGLPEDMQPVKPITYSVIKTGVIGLTRYLSTYWAECGVRCNALSPGGVFDGQDDEFVCRIEELIPISRMATKSEYRGAVQFLCSDASSYMNGHNLIMDGGRSVL